MELLQTLLAFAVVLGVLIVVHELGHYVVARWCGVKVLRFSVGMGKVIWSRRVGPDQTEWALSALPLGGYVKMLDAREDNLGPLSAEDAKREFTSQTVGKRIAIVAAGPIANFLLAIVIFAGLNLYGMPEPVPRLHTPPPGTVAAEAGLQRGDLVTGVNGEPVRVWSELRWKLLQAGMDKVPLTLEVLRPSGQSGQVVMTVALPAAALAALEMDGTFIDKLGMEIARPRAVLGEIVPDGPAAQAGLRAGDLIEKINGEPVADGVAFVERVRQAPGQRLLVMGVRDGETFSAFVVPVGELRGDVMAGKIRAQVDMRVEQATVRYGPIDAVGKGIEKTWTTSTMTLKMLGKMLIGEASLKNITGPITIADYAGQTARIGLISFLSFIAFISISLGVMNLLPIPVLDGGHLLYYSLEVLTGRRLPERMGEIAQRAGLGVLVALMAVALFNDVARLIS